MIKKLSLLALLVCSNLSLWSQSQLEYSYDDNGNRIVRDVIVLKAAIPSDGNDSANSGIDAIEFSEQNEGIVTLFPNPCSRYVTVQAVGTAVLEKVEIYTVNGVSIYESEIVGSESIVFDVSALAQGQYICRAYLAHKVHSLKFSKVN